MTDQDSFGLYLKRLRESRNLSLRQAAKEAGVSSGYLSQIEGEKRGKRRTGAHFAPHPQIVKQLADVYHVPAQELFDRAGFFEKEDDYLGFSEEKETDRCFAFVILDPEFRRVLTTADKKAIIDRYETLSGRRFITWAGENSLLNEKPEFKGLRRFGDGRLHAETIQMTLSLAEVAQELGIGAEAVETLIAHGHLRPVNPAKGTPVIEKADLRDLKSFAIQQGVKLLLARDRKHRPKTEEDFRQAEKELQARELDGLRRTLRERKEGKSKPGKKGKRGAL